MASKPDLHGWGTLLHAKPLVCNGGGCRACLHVALSSIIQGSRACSLTPRPNIWWGAGAPGGAAGPGEGGLRLRGPWIAPGSAR